MPGYNCSIKERMLYSSCKASLIDRLESQLGLEITKKVHMCTVENACKVRSMDKSSFWL